MRYTYIISLAALCAAPLAASAEMPPQTDWPPVARCHVSDRPYSVDGPQLQSASLDEISGLAASRWQTNVLWVHNSAGDAPNLYAVNALNGERLGTWEVRDARAVDWEDIALSVCDPAGSTGYCLFIADIGDDARERTDQMIYRVREPSTRDAALGMTQLTERADAFPVVYELPAGEPEPNPDAESLAVHPVTGKLYIVTKEQGKGRVLESDPPGAPGTPLTFRVIGEIVLPTPTAADISSDGARLVVRGESEAREYKITANDVRSAIQADGAQIARSLEPLGGSIAYTSFIPDLPSDIIKTDDNTTPYDLYIISGKERPQLKRYSHACDAVYPPVIRPEPHDMGINEQPDMGEPSEDGAGEGCSSAGASAPAALLWLLAPLAGLLRRRREDIT
jgi:uncharacterized protein (TIGR03382 family)